MTTTAWTGGSGNINTASNWSNGVPVSGVDAFINGSLTAPLTVSNSGTWDLNAADTMGVGANAASSFTNTGLFEMSGGAGAAWGRAGPGNADGNGPDGRTWVQSDPARAPYLTAWRV